MGKPALKLTYAAVALAIAVLFSHQAPAATSACVDLFRISSTAASSWRDRLDFGKAEQHLATSPVAKMIPINEYFASINKPPAGTHEIYLVILESGERAIFKPETKQDKPLAEVAAYRVSQALGLRLVPPTVVRTLGERTGSLQLFIETEFDLRPQGERHSTLKRLPQEKWNPANLLHFLIGHTDRHAGNYLLDDSGEFVLIDHGNIIGTAHWRLGEFPWTRKGPKSKGVETHEPFPFDAPTGVLHQPTREELTEVLGAYMSSSDIDKAVERMHLFPGGNYPFVFWRGQLWTQWRTGLGLLKITEITPEQRERLADLQGEKLKSLLQGLLRPEKIAEIDARIAQVLNAFNR